MSTLGMTEDLTELDFTPREVVRIRLTRWRPTGEVYAVAEVDEDGEDIDVLLHEGVRTGKTLRSIGTAITWLGARGYEPAGNRALIPVDDYIDIHDIDFLRSTR